MCGCQLDDVLMVRLLLIIEDFKSFTSQYLWTTSAKCFSVDDLYNYLISLPNYELSKEILVQYSFREPNDPASFCYLHNSSVDLK